MIDYLGVRVKTGLNGSFKCMGDIMIDANEVVGMVNGQICCCKVGSNHVVGRCKSIIVNKLMYGCGALAWYQYECEDLEVPHNEMGRLWELEMLEMN